MEYKKEKIGDTTNLEAERENAESGQSRSLELSIYLTHEIRTLLHPCFFNFFKFDEISIYSWLSSPNISTAPLISVGGYFLANVLK